MLNSKESINFWRDEDIVDLGCPFNFIVPRGANPRGEWPGRAPSLSDIYRELSLSRVSYLRINKNKTGKTFISILSGRIIVNGHIVEKEFDDKFFLNKRNGVEYASNRQRGYLISSGKRVRHEGIDATEKIRKKYSQRGYIIKRVLSKSKDLNEDLVAAFEFLEKQKKTVSDLDSNIKKNRMTNKNMPSEKRNKNAVERSM